MSTAFERLRRVYGDAETRAPGLAARFRAAGLSAVDFVDSAALSRLPVLKKEALVALQAADPPFAGFLACDLAELSRIYVSPGPIFEPSLAEDGTGHGMDTMFRAAGIGPGDLALNTWNYHLVPAGLLFDAGLRAVGATVVPSGTGNSSLQADLLTGLRPSVFLGSTAYFATLVAELEGRGVRLPDGWSLRHAFLGGEFGDWSVKRAALEARFGFATWSCYATADFGLIGYETPGESGYAIHEDRFVQICHPETGTPVGPGEEGEIVVTTLARGWPMIRFGTGDVARSTLMRKDGGVARISPLQGRVGASVKAREIFIYPSHVDELARRLEEVAEARVAIARPSGRDEITLELLASSMPVRDDRDSRVVDAFRTLTRLRPDHVRWIDRPDAFTITASLVDLKEG
jgi:phenylacetate-CoA ligase